MIDPAHHDAQRPHDPTPPDLAVPASSYTRVDYAALSHKGLVRDNNEDQFVVGRFGRSLDTLLTSLPAGRVPPRLEEVGYCLLVADGLGGGAAGELASEFAILALYNLILETPDWILSAEPLEVEEVLRRMTARFRRISDLLTELARQHQELQGMATTLTLAGSLGRSLLLAHVGDSRAYLLRDQGLWQLTRDHTSAQQMVEAGLIRHAREASARLQSMLTQVLGADAYLGDPEVQQLTLLGGDQLLLCTDGLTGMVPDLVIAEILSTAATAEEACQALVDTALRNGGKDNVTVALLRYLSIGAP
jgi:protein phosphatase